METSKKTWRDLIVWQKSHQLVLAIYNMLKSFPKEERFAIIDQIRRAAISVSTNIVEGQARSSKRDFIRFLIYSKSSLEELRYLLLLAKDLVYLSEEEYNYVETQSTVVSAMLNRLIKSL
jgi:four helix bundle protein